MAKRVSGEVKIEVFFTGNWDGANRSQYKGMVSAKGIVWRFDDLFVHPKGASDAPLAYDIAAECALGFATHYEQEEATDGYLSRADAQTIECAADYTSEDTEEIECVGSYRGDCYMVFRSAKVQATYYQIVNEVLDAKEAK